MTLALDPVALEAAETAHARVTREYRGTDDPQSFDAAAAEECVRAYYECLHAQLRGDIERKAA